MPSACLRVVWHFHVYLILRRLSWTLLLPHYANDTCDSPTVITPAHIGERLLYFLHLHLSFTRMIWGSSRRNLNRTREYESEYRGKMQNSCYFHFNNNKRDVESRRRRNHVVSQKENRFRSENMLPRDVYVTTRIITTYSSLLPLVISQLSHLYIFDSSYCYYR